MVRGAGFKNLRVGCMVDVFSGSVHESDAKSSTPEGSCLAPTSPGAGAGAAGPIRARWHRRLGR